MDELSNYVFLNLLKIPALWLGSAMGVVVALILGVPLWFGVLIVAVGGFLGLVCQAWVIIQEDRKS